MDLQKTSELTDVELLEIEMDLLWGSGAGPELVVACARDSARARISNRLRSEFARTLAAASEYSLLRMKSNSVKRILTIGSVRPRVIAATSGVVRGH